MEADVLNALQSRSAYMPGGRDDNGHLLIVITVPEELQPWTKSNLEMSVEYLLASVSGETKNGGFTVIVDAQKCPWRLARAHVRHATTFVGHNQRTLIIRPEVFWDKQHVDNCAKSPKKGQPIIIPKSRLGKYFDLSQLPKEFGGTIVYNHNDWIQKRVRIEEFKQLNDKALNDLENLHILLLDNKSVRASQTDSALRSCSACNHQVQKTLQTVIDTGNHLLNVFIVAEPSKMLTQDMLDARELIKASLNNIEQRQTSIAIAWSELVRSMDDARDLASLEKGVAIVTNWILLTAETLLNAQREVGHDVCSAEELRRNHETLEMQCLEAYGFYAELLYKIAMFDFPKDSYVHKDLVSQKDFMDFVCRSFATRLERRRNMLITSLRFFRLVSEYFDKTSEVFESLVMGNKIDDFNTANMNLRKLKESQQTLGSVEKELIKEGEKLSDILSMPVKDALGRDLDVDYSEDIANISDILDATVARRNIFIDSVELQKLTLEQVTHIHAYEAEADLVITWMEDLYSVMVKTHSHIGCTTYEIQSQKEELQTFQETAKGTYTFSCQLLDAAFALRQSCKLTNVCNAQKTEHVQMLWRRMQTISQEQMTRLRVSAVFHRSVENHCIKLAELRQSVVATNEIEELERRRIRLRKYLSCRERLLVEVGRMLRLGRLLRTRLKEPFVLSEDNSGVSLSDAGGKVQCLVEPFSGNALACEAITSKLTEVARAAESLDIVLSTSQIEVDGFDFIPKQPSEKSFDSNGIHNNDWYSSIKSSKSSTEDESFATVSDCNSTPQSRSSSYHTASECRASPWWDNEKTSFDSIESEIDPETPSMQLLSGVLSSTSASFDDSDNSLFSLSLQEITSGGSNRGADDSCDQLEKSASPSDDTASGGDIMDTEQRTMAALSKSDSAKDMPLSWGSYYQTFVSKQTIKRCI